MHHYILEVIKYFFKVLIKKFKPQYFYLMYKETVSFE